MNFQEELLTRFIRYAKISTQVNTAMAGKQCPTNPQELELAKLLVEELKEIGVDEIYTNEQGFIIGRLNGTDSDLDSVAFMSHMDTSDAFPADNVTPIVHKNYNGEAIVLKNGITIDPKTDPDLAKYKGDTIITSDGTTLLSADDKSGVAAIMTAFNYLKKHPELKYGAVEAVFTPDEEGGDGMSSFPLEELKSKIAYTIDGSELGELEYECYNAYQATVTFTGIAIHPAVARGRMVNALSMLTAYCALIPRNESPEATDGYFGCYWPVSAAGNSAKATLHLALRDHNQAEIERRLKALKSFAQAVEGAFPGGKVSVETKEDYRNMREGIERNPEVMARVLKAFKAAGLEASVKPVRGGTDGSRLTAMGVPAPNIFTGGHNFHGPQEWLSLSSLEKACQVIIEIAKSN